MKRKNIRSRPPVQEILPLPSWPESRVLIPRFLASSRMAMIQNMLKAAKDSLDLGIVVSDIKASLHFYQNVLGLEFVGTNPSMIGTVR
jgi:hypothetical protein